jgi:2-polyprenyl-3-methyl-5-hydroxy-6-metoxy-1,4-benzoquinol methylase
MCRPRGSVDVVTHNEYYDANRTNWGERVAGHWLPDGYDAPGFIADQDRISGVVQFDRPYLGDLSGRSLLHLQCHFGMDTLSLARCGAMVTGIDFSTEAIAAATRLSDESGTPGRLVETHGPARPGYIADQLHGLATEGDVVASLQAAAFRGEG